MGRFVALALAGSALALTMPASAGTMKLDVTVTSTAGNLFSAPIFTFTNLSDPGVDVTRVSVNGGPPWDYVWIGPVGTPYEILDPAGGTRTITTGEESATDPNNGCTASIGYSLTSFNPGDLFRFSADPESGGCGSAVIDIRSFLNADQIGIGVTFADGTALSGSDWTMELIDPQGSPSADGNQRYRLTLSAVTSAVPEPAGWAMMIAGFAAVGAGLRRRDMRVAFA